MAQSDVYTIILKKDADFWQDELTATDQQGELVPFASASLIIHPDDDSGDVVWDEGNGKLVMPSTGVIGFEVELEEIEDYTWTTGTYCLAVVYSNGKRDGSLMRGPVQVMDAC